MVAQKVGAVFLLHWPRLGKGFYGFLKEFGLGQKTCELQQG